MILGNLDNEVYFKKVFTDPEVFRAFVKDVAGVDFIPGKIETEKQLDRKVSPIKFKLDIFAESKDHRIIVEIQRVDYDYNFDRFMHYFLAVPVDLQRKSQNYKFEQEVYTIVVLTAPFRTTDRYGVLIKDDVLVSDLNPRTLSDKMRDLYPHKLIFLNHNNVNPDTPPAVADWLKLIHESIENPESPDINTANPFIAKAAELADINKMPGEVLEDAKIAERKKEVLEMTHETGKAEGIAETIETGVKNLLKMKMPAEQIASVFSIPIEQVRQMAEDFSKK